jgi:thiamine biosynthesis lipoprotein
VTAINNARSRTGWQSMTLDMHRRTVRLTKPGMQLDLGGIAKGYACDEARRVLERHGIRSALIEMGGDLVLSGAPPGRSGWTVEVPNAGTANGSATMTLRDCAVSSSGDTEQFAVIGGRRYSHVVDPRTGHASTNRVQATVIARDGFTSDPLSTAMTLLGQREREALLGRYQGSRAYVRRLEGMGE